MNRKVLFSLGFSLLASLQPLSAQSVVGQWPVNEGSGATIHNNSTNTSNWGMTLQGSPALWGYWQPGAYAFAGGDNNAETTLTSAAAWTSGDNLTLQADFNVCGNVHDSGTVWVGGAIFGGGYFISGGNSAGYNAYAFYAVVNTANPAAPYIELDISSIAPGYWRTALPASVCNPAVNGGWNTVQWVMINNTQANSMTVQFVLNGAALGAPVNITGGYMQDFSGLPAYLGTKFYIGAAADGGYYAFDGSIRNVSLARVASPVVSSPVFTTTPQSQTVFLGSNVTFTAVASGAAPLSYQWLFNGTNVISGATSASLTLTNVATNQSGAYTLVVTNSFGAASATANLTVSPPLPAQYVIGQWPVNEGSGITLYNDSPDTANWGMTLQGNPALWGYWQPGAYAFAQGNNNAETALTSAAAWTSGDNLTLQADFNVCGNVHDSGTVWVGGAIFGGGYFISGGNSAGFNTYAFYAVVNTANPAAPYAEFDVAGLGYWRQALPASVCNPAVNGGWNTVQWVITNNPQANSMTVQFLLNGAAVGGVVNISGGYMQDFAEVPGYMGTKFYIGAAADSGYYAFQGSIRNVSLATVLSPVPVFTTTPPNQIVLPGTNVTFTAVASGTAPLSYQWLFNGTNVIGGATSASLTLTNVSSSQSGAYTLVVSNGLGAASATANLTVGPLWPDASLLPPPAVTWVSSVGPDYSLTYENVLYSNRMASVFAYYSVPAAYSGKLPAIALVHGGGGTAYQNWAQQWASYGYAAIAMDLNGSNVLYGRPWDSDHFNAGETLAAKDTWYYHATCAAIRAVSFLSSRPEVDTNRIAMMGISWGGWITSIAASVDPRVKCAVPVYGCGFIFEYSGWTPISSPSYRNAFDPCNYLGSATLPMLWMAGANDPFYPPVVRRQSMRLTQGETQGDNTVCLKNAMDHNYNTPWTNAPEIRQFVDSKFNSGPALVKINSMGWTTNSIWATWAGSVPVRSAVLVTTTAANPWPDFSTNTWTVNGAGVTIDQANRCVTSSVPLAAKVFYLQITDTNNLTVTTEHVDRTVDAFPGQTIYHLPTPVLPASAITILGGVPHFSFATSAGYKYRLAYKNVLADSSWLPVIAPPMFPPPDGWCAASTGSPMSLGDTNAAVQPQRFYRLEAATP